MKYKRKQFGNQFDVDWTPMIDMTFQLIAFFMFVLNFSEADANELIQLPSSELAKPPEAPLESPLTLQLTKTGTVLFAGDEVTIAALRSYLIRESQVFKSLKKNQSDSTIIIRADNEAQTGQVQELIKLCQDTGFEKFALRAKQQRDPRKDVRP